MRTKLTAEEQRKRDLAQIHIAKTQLGLDDDTYRDLLWNVAKVRSSRDLTITARLRVLQHLKEKGWKKKLPNKVQRGKSPTTAIGKAPLMSKISALLADQKLPWSYANGIAKQMYRKEYGIERVDWCNEEQLRGIIVALMNRRKKHES